MTSYYTNVQVRGNKILYRGVEDGRRVQRKLDYNPKLYVSSKEASKFTTIYGEPVAEVSPGSIRDCRDFIERYKDVKGFSVYGQTRFEYTFIAENHDDNIDWDMNEILVANIDIETESENGFPEPTKADEVVTAITVKLRGIYFVFGCGTYFNSNPALEVRYFRCRDEHDLLSQFIGWWAANHPDLLTGWNIKGFDIPYLVNRITKLFGEDEVRKLSPWGVIQTREDHNSYGNDVVYYTLLGIAIIDYIEIYKKYAPEGKSQETYKLDNIAHVELGERKLSYEEIGSIRDLHKKNFQTFIEYNIQDVGLVDRLEDKLRLLELALTLAYDSKTNYEDCFTQVRMWDILIYNHLRKKNMVIPQNTKHEKNAMYEGAYVKDPQTGRHGWLASFDLTSLYPSLLMQYNISPETLVEPLEYSDRIREFVSSNRIDGQHLLAKDIDTSVLKDENLSMTPNIQFFRRDKTGFMPEIIQDMFQDRQRYKKQMLQAQKDLEAINRELGKFL